MLKVPVPLTLSLSTLWRILRSADVPVDEVAVRVQPDGTVRPTSWSLRAGLAISSEIAAV